MDPSCRFRLVFFLGCVLASAACGGASSAAPRPAKAPPTRRRCKVVRVERTPLDALDHRHRHARRRRTGDAQPEGHRPARTRCSSTSARRCARAGAGAADAHRLRAPPAPGRSRAAAGARAARARPRRRATTRSTSRRPSLVRQAQAVARRGAAAARSHRDVRAARHLGPRRSRNAPRRSSRSPKGRYQDALEEVRNRQAVLAQRRSELALARQQLDDTTLRSPIDGVVRERHAFAGEYRAAGTPIVTVVRQHPLRLQLAVPERAAADVRVGQAVRVTVEGDPDVYEGRVARLSPAITEGNRTLPIEAEVPEPGRPAAAGHVRHGRDRHRRDARPRRPAVGARRLCRRREGAASSRTARRTSSACAPAGASATASRSSRASTSGDLVDHRRPAASPTAPPCASTE